MAPTAVVPTITVDTAVPAMKRCQLDSRLAAVVSVTTFHHGRRQHLIAATTDLYSRQASEKTASPLRLRTGATRMKHISVVLFPPFLGGPESGHGPTAYVLELPTSCRSSTAYDIPWSPPQYSGSNNGYGTNRGPQQQYGSGSRSYYAKPFVRHHRGGDGTALWPQQQHGPRPFCSFGREQRGACRDGPPDELAHSIAQGQAQWDVEMGCHGGPVSKVPGPPERGGPPLQARHQRGLQPPSGTLSPPAAVISDSASEEWL